MIQNNLQLNELELLDITNGFEETLEHLTKVGIGRQITPFWEGYMRDVRANPYHRVYVVKRDAQIVGTTSIIMIPRAIHNCSFVGHIEDVATREGEEGQGIGSMLINECINYAREFETDDGRRAYKLYLGCSDENKPWYEKLGFRYADNGMRYDIVHPD